MVGAVRRTVRHSYPALPPLPVSLGQQGLSAMARSWHAAPGPQDRAPHAALRQVGVPTPVQHGWEDAAVGLNLLLLFP